jgi:hypothetical protein
VYGTLTYCYSPGGVLKSVGSLLASFCESVEAYGTLTYYYSPGGVLKSVGVLADYQLLREC